MENNKPIGAATRDQLLGGWTGPQLREMEKGNRVQRLKQAIKNGVEVADSGAFVPNSSHRGAYAGP